MDTEMMVREIHREANVAAGGPEGGESRTAEECQRMLDKADAMIDQALSGDAEAFLNANKQQGGQ